MAVVSVRNFGISGLISDRGAWDIPLTALDEAFNSAFYNGRLGRSVGTRTLKNIADEDSRPKELVIWKTNTDNRLTGISEKGVISFVGRNETFSIYDPEITDDNERSFQVVQSGENLIVFSSTHDPRVVSGLETTSVSDLSEWPTGLRAEVATYFNGHIFLGNLSGAGYGHRPSTIRWSNLYDQSSEVPSTWDLTDTTATTGDLPLPSEYGPVVAMQSMRGRLYVYTRDAVFEVTPSTLEQVFQARLLFADDGAMNSYSVQNVEGEQLVVGNNDIYMHNGQTKRSIADKRVKNLFYGSVRGEDTVRTVFSPERTEVLVCFSDSESNPLASTQSLRYEYKLDAWTLDSFDTPVLSLTSGQISTVSSNTYDDLTETYDDRIYPYSSDSSENSAPITVTVDTEGNYGELNSAPEDSGDSQKNMNLTHSHLDFDKELPVGTNRILRISRLLPQIQGSGEVTFWLASRNEPEGALINVVRKVFTVGVDHKVDLRITGRYFFLQIQSSDSVILDSIDFVVDRVARN